MEIKKSYLTILAITALTTLFVFLIEENESLDQVIKVEKEPTQETSASPISNIKTPSHTTEPSTTPPPEEPDDLYYVEPPKVAKVVEIETWLIDDINAFLLANKNNLDNLPLNVQISLNNSLQKCSLFNRVLDEPYYSEEDRTSLYFTGVTPKMLSSIEQTKQMCTEVDENLILGSYEALEAIAIANPTIAAPYFFSARSPEFMAANIRGDDVSSDADAIIKRHLEKKLPLLIESALRGNLEATGRLAWLYSSFGSLSRVNPDPVKSLGYFIAHNSTPASGNDALHDMIHKIITRIGDGLYLDELEQAKKLAGKLIESWDQQEHLTNQERIN